MQNVHFTIDDLAKLKIVPTVGPVAEAVFAVDLLRRGAGGAPFAKWREAVGLRMRRARSSADALTGPGGLRPRPAPASGELQQRARGSWLFDLVSSEGAADDVECLDPVMERVHDLGVAPYWAQARTHLQLDRDRRCRLLVGGGIEHLLSTLHAWIDWSPPVLTVASGRQQEIELRGNGLVIVPSLFLAQPMVFADPAGTDRAPVLVYPAPLDLDTADSLWSAARAGDRALAALVGRTRAKVLQALTETCSTSELGRRLGISPAAASQHATVLREAGLVTSRRRSNTMLHSLTALGSALAMVGGPALDSGTAEPARTTCGPARTTCGPGPGARA
ncbi:winged helix-turn-helix domain-containing protein [Streptomyces sp. NPDC018059]|uniref:winged helix-turn-helix domain-containing protein n=1 Tax=Streptomyces sp. NPDC018059 TaxID=3365041 RepID=UPI0037BD473C